MLTLIHVVNGNGEQAVVVMAGAAVPGGANKLLELASKLPCAKKIAGVVMGSADDVAKAIWRRKNGQFAKKPGPKTNTPTFTDAERVAAWKRLADDPKSGLTAAERAQIKARGRGPQRMNEYGELETMELSHEPIPLREGGTEVVPRWPADHAAIDRHRHLKKRD